MAVLSTCPLFRDLAPEDRCKLEACFQLRTATRGELFFKQEALATGLHVLSRGAVKLSRTDRDGRQLLVRVAIPPEPFGMVAAATNRTDYSAEAMTDSEALVLRADEFLGAIADHPTVAQNAFRLMASRLADMRERLDDLGARHISRSVARALLRGISPTQRSVLPYDPITLALSHQDLADIVGASLYTVSRILSSWKRLGIVDVRRGRVVVQYVEGLAAMAAAGRER